LVSQSDEIKMGQQAYVPAQQSQGGVYDVDPELTRYVRDVGERLAEQAAQPLPYEFVVLNNSVPNAWAMPGGKIAINRGLLTELNSEAELAAVLGHEIVHADARHSAKQQTTGMLSQVLVAAAEVVTSDSSYGSLAVGSASAASQLLSATYGRGAELESDKYGMQYMSRAGYDTSGAITLQETFVRLSEGRKSDWVSGLFASHPPSQERVDANRATAATLPAGGKRGVDSYRLAMQKTMDTKAAYDAYDEGREALSKDKPDEALTLASKALDIFPAEANFHALRGDVRLMEANYEWAVTNYTRAIDRRGDFFYYYLQRGLANNELKQMNSAVADLERSVELLPTAPAYLVLGDIAGQRGETAEAIKYFKAVTAYRCDADGNANLVVSVQNKTGLAIQGVEVEITYSDGGQQRVVRRSIAGQVAPGKVASVNTGLGPYTSGSCPVDVVAAQIAE
jgi:predicted Zn-dependent protease